jgi:hypothetical protein
MRLHENWECLPSGWKYKQLQRYIRPKVKMIYRWRCRDALRIIPYLNTLPQDCRDDADPSLVDVASRVSRMWYTNTAMFQHQRKYHRSRREAGHHDRSPVIETVPTWLVLPLMSSASSELQQDRSRRIFIMNRVIYTTINLQSGETEEVRCISPAKYLLSSLHLWLCHLRFSDEEYMFHYWSARLQLIAEQLPHCWIHMAMGIRKNIRD